MGCLAISSGTRRKTVTGTGAWTEKRVACATRDSSVATLLCKRVATIVPKKVACKRVAPRPGRGRGSRLLGVRGSRLSRTLQCKRVVTL